MRTTRGDWRVATVKTLHKTTTYPVVRTDGRVVEVTVPENNRYLLNMVRDNE